MTQHELKQPIKKAALWKLHGTCDLINFPANSETENSDVKLSVLWKESCHHCSI